MMKNMQVTANKLYVSATQKLFYCNFKIPNEAKASLLLKECFDFLHRVDQRYNSYQPGSFFWQINKNAGTWVPVDSSCIDMLNYTLKLSVITKGAYDISCMPLLRLWGFYDLHNLQIPTKDTIKETLKKVDYQQIEIKNGMVRIPKDFELITGSFIKSFAVDCLIDFLKTKGITDAIINADGSTFFALNDAAHPQWKVNIPFPTNASQMMKIPLTNQAFSLSGTIHNNRIINGKSWHADVLSTALFCVGTEQHKHVIETLLQTENFNYYRFNSDGSFNTNLCY
nr:FAD:protein FMN transferase [uncultured Flavobacterium sp.]